MGVVLCLGSAIRLIGSLRGLKGADVMAALVFLNTHLITTAAKGYTKQPRLSVAVRTCDVFHVLPVGCLAQIHPPIIITNTIDVVNLVS